MYYYNSLSKEIEKVKILEEIDNCFKIENKNGIFSKDLFFKELNHLYIKLLLDRYKYGDFIFKDNEREPKLKEMLESIFDLNYFIKNYEYVIDNFISILTRDYRHYGYDLEKYVVIGNDILFNLMMESNCKDQKAYQNWKHMSLFLSKDIESCYNNKHHPDYQEIYNLIGLNLQSYYNKYNMNLKTKDIIEIDKDSVVNWNINFN